MQAPLKLTIKLLILVFSCSGALNAQPVEERIRFINYLVNNNLYEESRYESDQILKTYNLSSDQMDSVYYLKGWSQYNLKKLDQSSRTLKNVSPESPHYKKSQLFAAYNQIHLKHYNKADKLFEQISPKTKFPHKFDLFLKSGSSLLQRDTKSFFEIKNELPSDYYGYSSELNNLNDIAHELDTRNPKSPVMAGILSGIVPGSGKIYTGKTGQGITAFLMTTGLALVTLENYNKKGPRKFETILFGSAFTVFYIGNIYGAVFSAKIVNNEYNELTDRKILFNIHVPLRNVFD